MKASLFGNITKENISLFTNSQLCAEVKRQRSVRKRVGDMMNFACIAYIIFALWFTIDAIDLLTDIASIPNSEVKKGIGIGAVIVLSLPVVALAFSALFVADKEVENGESLRGVVKALIMFTVSFALFVADALLSVDTMGFVAAGFVCLMIFCFAAFVWYKNVDMITYMRYLPDYPFEKPREMYQDARADILNEHYEREAVIAKSNQPDFEKIFDD